MKEGESVEDKKLLTIKELGEVLQVSEMSLYRYQRNGMPFIKIGSLTRYDLDEVLEYFKDKQRGIK